MTRLLQAIRVLLGAKAPVLYARKPHVLVRREVPVLWTKYDSLVLAQLLETPTWKKLVAIQEDGIVHDTLGAVRKGFDAEWLEPYVTGRMAMLDSIYSYARLKRHNLTEELQEEGADGSAQPGGAPEETTTLQHGREDT